MLLGEDYIKLLGSLEDSLEHCYMTECVDHTGNMTEVDLSDKQVLSVDNHTAETKTVNNLTRSAYR